MNSLSAYLYVSLCALLLFAGYTNANWADWSILPAINIVNDAIFTGDLESLARPLLDSLIEAHTYLNLVDPLSGLVENGMKLGALVDWPSHYNDGMVQSPYNAVVQVCFSMSCFLLSDFCF